MSPHYKPTQLKESGQDLEQNSLEFRARAMESKVEGAVLAGKKISFPADDREEEDVMAIASSSAPPASIFAFLAPPLLLLRHVASLCAGYLGLDGGGLKPSVPALASSSSTAAASEDCTEVEVVLEVRSRGVTAPKPSFPPPKPRSTPVESRKAARGGDHH